MEGYAVILEKKGRARGMGFGGRPWAVRTFKLTEQNFEYFDGNKLKGTIDTKNAQASIIPPSEADGKEYPFVLKTASEDVILNGSSWAIRDKCIEVLNRSAKNPKWDNAQDNEKYRLEARLRELEHDRQVQSESNVALAFQTAGAVKKAGAAGAAIKKEKVGVFIGFLQIRISL